MALGVLMIIFIALAVISCICIASLYLVKEPRINSIIFFCTAALGMVVGYMNVTSLPSNYIAPRIVAVLFGLLAVVGIILKYKQSTTAAKLMVTASVVFGVVQLFFL